MRHIFSGLRTERGSSLVEFTMCAPILLMIAGTTLDMSRYIRYLQITSFVSQETTNLSYLQCSDLTVYNPPTRNQTTLEIDSAATKKAIDTCVNKIKDDAQAVLDKILPRSVISAAIIRYDLNLANPGDNPCLVSHPPTLITANCTDGACQSEREQKWPSGSQLNATTIQSRSSTSTEIPSSLWLSGLKLDGSDFVVKDLKTNETLLSVQRADKCEGRSVVAVEVAYLFEPIVKFVPDFVIGVKDGIHRETSVL
jgi:hypothetical protein